MISERALERFTSPCGCRVIETRTLLLGLHLGSRWDWISCGLHAASPHLLAVLSRQCPQLDRRSRVRRPA